MDKTSLKALFQTAADAAVRWAKMGANHPAMVDVVNKYVDAVEVLFS